MKNPDWLRLSLVLHVLVMLVFVCALGPPTLALAQGHHPLVIPPNERVTGNIATIAQDIEVQGTVAGDVTSWSGNITVQGHVGGDVVSYSGRVNINPGAHVDGNILALNGEMHRAADANIIGQVVDGRAEGGTLTSLIDVFIVRDRVDNALPQPKSALLDLGVLSRILFGMVLAGFLLVFCLLWIAVWPHRTTTAALALRALPGRSLVLGLLTTLILTLLLLPLITFLTVTLIGLPLIALLFIIIQVPYIYGLAALAQALRKSNSSKRLPMNIGLDRGTCTMILIAVALLGVLTAIAPISGLAMFYLLASPGFGAAILSRGGLALPRAL